MRIGTAGWLIAAAVLVSACDQSAKIENQPEMAATAGKGTSWRDPREPVPPPANQPSPDSPVFASRMSEDYAYATGRGRDQSSNPGYIVTTTPWIPEYFASGDTKILHDPHRLDWASARGMAQDVEFTNRYGARMRARLFGPNLPYADPRTGGLHSGPFPAVLFIPGHAPPKANSAYSGFASYDGQIQQLAENGYLVLAIAPQGMEGSEHFTPPHPMCDPNGDWRKPQELGITEPGECAGHDGPLPPWAGRFAAVYQALDGVSPDAAAVASIVLAPIEEDTFEWDADFYEVFRHRFVFAALDGADWLLSDANPWRELVDRKRIGIMGHSAGADAALVAANGDPLKRFGAVVTFDGHGLPPRGTPARVPTLFQQAENMNVQGPYTSSVPPNERVPSFRNYLTVTEHGVAAMLVTLRGSTHAEWNYIPYRQHNPVAQLAMPYINASSKGDTVGHYYALAWFDRWLQRDRASDATRRLLARNFDDSADTSSIGSGTWDPITQANVPYRLQGEPVADHLSVWFSSRVAFDGVSCNDVQDGCEGN